MDINQTHAVSLAAPAFNYADRALATIDGARQAEEIIAALRAGTAEPDALAGLLGRLCGHQLDGACSALAKVLERSA